MNINLLPVREKKSYTGLLIGLSFLVMVIAASVLIFFGYSNAKQRIEELNIELANVQTMKEIQQKELSKLVSTNESKTLKKDVEQLKKIPNNSVELMNEFIQLLPERGFFRSFDFDQKEKVTLEVQFDTMRDASAYLSALLKLNYVRDVAMEDVKAEEVKLEVKQTEDLTADQKGILQKIANKINDQITPRYVSKYTITLNPNKLNQVKKKEDEQ